MPGLVVGGAAAVEPVTALGRLERLACPSRPGPRPAGRRGGRRAARSAPRRAPALVATTAGAPPSTVRISTSNPSARNRSAVASAERRTSSAWAGSALTDGIRTSASRSARTEGRTSVTRWLQIHGRHPSRRSARGRTGQAIAAPAGRQRRRGRTARPRPRSRPDRSASAHASSPSAERDPGRRVDLDDRRRGAALVGGARRPPGPRRTAARAPRPPRRAPGATSTASRCLTSSRRSASSAAPARKRATAASTSAGSAGRRRAGTARSSQAADAGREVPARGRRLPWIASCSGRRECRCARSCGSSSLPCSRLTLAPWQPAPASAGTKAMPGSFTGYAFDTCDAPSQRTMDRWRTRSKYCGRRHLHRRDEPRLRRAAEPDTRRGSASSPARAGGCCRWSSGRQASVLPEGLLHAASGSPADPRRRLRRGAGPGRGRGRRRRARRRAAWASPGGSVLWFDLEHFDIEQEAVPALGAGVHLRRGPGGCTRLGYRSGFYSSASSGIPMVDDARRKHAAAATRCPTTCGSRSGTASDTVRSAYICERGWWPHRRVHQYRGGHDERHGGSRLNVDSNFLSTGRGHGRRQGRRRPAGCGSSFPTYPRLERGDRGARVRGRAVPAHASSGATTASCTAGSTRPRSGRSRAFQRRHAGLPTSGVLTAGTWTSLLSQGRRPAGEVRLRRQRRTPAAAGAQRRDRRRARRSTASSRDRSCGRSRHYQRRDRRKPRTGRRHRADVASAAPRAHGRPAAALTPVEVGGLRAARAADRHPVQQRRRPAD